MSLRGCSSAVSSSAGTAPSTGISRPAPPSPRPRCTSGRQVLSTDFAWDSWGLITLDETGNYRVVVDAVNDQTGNYGFRLTDPSLVPVIQFDQVISDRLSPGNQDRLYRFTAAKDQRLFLDALTRSSDKVDWYVINPQDQYIYHSYHSDIEMEMPQDGEYILVVRGRAGFENSVDYTFSLVDSDVITRSMNVGEVVEGAIAKKGGRHTLEFEATEGQQVFFDSLDGNAYLPYTLYDPFGGVVINRADSRVDRAFLDGFTFVYDGTYKLMFDGDNETIGKYKFRLLDKASAAAYTPDTDLTGAVDYAASGAKLFKFTIAENLNNANKQQYVYLDGLTPTDGIYGAWILYNANGQYINSARLWEDREMWLGAADYYLVMQGYSYNANYNFRVITSETPNTAIAIGDVVSGNIANTGTAGTYGSASAVPVFVTNAQGQVTSVTNTNIAINGSAVTGNISGSAGSVANALTLGTYLTGTSFNGSAAVTATVDATSANTASKVVARDGSGSFSAGTITATLSGSSTSATTATNLAGGAANQIPYQTAAGTTAFTTAASGTNYVLNYNGSAFTWVSGTISGVALGSNLNSLTAGTYLTGTAYNGSAAQTWTVDATSANTASKVVARDASGNFSAGTITATLSGTATNVSGTVATANGGTGLTSFTSGGVVYASSTSALATGSALTWNGTNLGIGTATPNNYSSAANNLVIAGTGQRGITIASTDSNQSNLFFADADSGSGEYAGYLAYFHSSDSLAFAANATEGMRLTSTGLGIGTTSPSSKLDVSTTTGFTFAATATAGAIVGARGVTGGSFAVKTNSYSASYDSGLAIDGTYPAGGGALGESNINIKAFGVYSGGGFGSTLGLWTSSNTTLSERFRIGSAGQLGIGGANYGTAGQVLTSAGSGAAPSWQTSTAAAKGFAVGMSLVFGR